MVREEFDHLVPQVVQQVVHQVVSLSVPKFGWQGGPFVGPPMCISSMLQLSTWKLYKWNQLVLKLSCHQAVVVLTGGGEVLLCYWSTWWSAK